jgi:DNA-directed RNA polymerase I subunit RPA49
VRTTLHRENAEIADLRKAHSATLNPLKTTTRYDLALEFGSAKTQKALAASRQNYIKTDEQSLDDNAMEMQKATLDAMNRVIDAGQDEILDITNAVEENKPRPPPNLEANSVQEVYPLEILVPGAGLQVVGPSVSQWITTINEGGDIKTRSLFVSKRLFGLVKKEELQKLRILRYILLLFTLHSSLKSKMKGPKLVPKREELLKKLDVPASVVDGAVKKFSTKGKEMDKWHIDNLMTHICALALWVDNWEVDIADIVRDTGFTGKQ